MRRNVDEGKDNGGVNGDDDGDDGDDNWVQMAKLPSCFQGVLGCNHYLWFILISIIS